MKVLLKSFHFNYFNGHTAGFGPHIQKLERPLILYKTSSFTQGDRG